MIDTHAHLDDKQFELDREEVISRAFSSGIEKIINIGSGLGSSQRSVELAENHENIFAAVGLHPRYFLKHKSWNEKHKNMLEELAKRKKVIAIGEIGLDYFSYDGKTFTQEEKEFQKEGFIFQLELAKKLNLPVVIHCRGARPEDLKTYRETGEAYDDVLEIIEKFPTLSYVFHSFGGRLSFLDKTLKKENIIFSFAGNITYNKPNSEIFEVIRTIPLEKIMLETDCPYLAPLPNRGKRNQPSYVKLVYEKVAQIKAIDNKKVEETVRKTVQDFFGI